MKVLKYAVNKEPELIEIENGLEAMQSEVDGYIETVTFPSVNTVLVCNEEGKVKNYPMNALVISNRDEILHVIHGDFFICSFEGDAFSDITVEAALWAIKHIKHIEQYRYE